MVLSGVDYNGTNEMTVGRLLIPPAMAPMPGRQTD
jgi:hypothetical protein